MSVQAISWVLEKSESRLGSRHVMISIANHADRQGVNAYPSVRTIALESRLSEREVQYALSILTSMGELAIEPGAGPGGTHRYSLPLMGGEKFSSPGGEKFSGEGAKTGAKNPQHNKEEQKQPNTKPPYPPFEISPKQAERREKERRDGLTRARARGLRDFRKYPFEDWERPLAEHEKTEIG